MSLRLFTLRVRQIEMKSSMLQKNFMTSQKMTQQQVEMRKKELEQSLDQILNPLKNIMDKMESDLELKQNFFTKYRSQTKKNS